MNSNRDQQLESVISRELKSLPELTAPASVANRVMAAIESRQRVPWYCRSWSAWPVALQTASFLVLLALFVGVCFAGWELPRTEAVRRSTQEAGQWISGFNSAQNLFDALAGSAVLVVKKLGVIFTVACWVAVGLGYALFLGLGTLWFRLAVAKRSPAHCL